MTVTAEDFTAEQVATAHRVTQEGIIARIIALLLEIWDRIITSDPFGWWFSGAEQEMYAVLSLGQEMMAGQSREYVQTSLGAQGSPAVVPRVNATRFAGRAADGRDLDTLLLGAVIAVQQAVESGQTEEQAKVRGMNSLLRIANTELADAGREADHVALVGTESKATLGWVRMLTPPSCGRCAVLAGRFYRWNEGFFRHENCFPAGVVVSGPRFEAATRRWFEGELVVLTTASGEQLPVTGNHPVLTDRGWLPAHLIVKGDHIVRSLLGQSATPLVVPDEQQMPARVENVPGSYVMPTFRRVPTTSEDFHGDGGHGQVDVVFADGALRDGIESPNAQPSRELGFTGGVKPSPLFAGGGALPLLGSSIFGGGVELASRGRPRKRAAEPFTTKGSTQQMVGGLRHSSDRVVGGGDLSLALLRRHLAGPDETRGRAAPPRYPGRFEVPSNHVAAHAEHDGQGVLTLPCRVTSGQRLAIQADLTLRWDAPAGALSVQNAAAYASRGLDLLRRLAGQVELDRVVSVRRSHFAGHVYNLTSAEGWIAANSLIVSNCDCRHIPATEDNSDDLTTDPRRYFDSLAEAQQNELFGKANAEAIRDGSDIAQVVNATSRKGGMYTVGGRRYTREGTTRRGFYGSKAAGRRPIPQQIYKDAGADRDQAVRDLRRYGYIVD